MTFTEIYLTDLERFQQNICNGCGMPTGDADSSGHLVPSLWDLHMIYLLRPILFRTCRYFTGLCSSNIPRYFLDFALSYCNAVDGKRKNLTIINSTKLLSMTHFTYVFSLIPLDLTLFCANCFPS